MTIYYLCPDLDTPSGGIKQIYRHVDILSQHGFSAAVLHQQNEFRCSWFVNTTPIAYLDEPWYHPIVRRYRSFRQQHPRPLLPKLSSRTSIKSKKSTSLITEKDVLVIPELWAEPLKHFCPAIPRVIFNQNSYLTFTANESLSSPEQNAYRQQNILGTLVIAEYGKQYLQYTFPSLDIHRIHNGIPPLFHYTPEKKKQIAFMPRTLKKDLEQVFVMLGQRGALEGWKLVPIDKKNEQETAKILQDSLIFLSSSHEEGCPLPPAEAGACGCIVVGYCGIGGQEYLKPDFSFPVPERDVLAFASTLEHVIELAETQPSMLKAKGKQFSEFIHKTYSLSVEEAEVCAAWNKILSTDRSFLSIVTDPRAPAPQSSTHSK